MSAMGVALSYVFVFLAALPIRYVRITYGRNLFLFINAIGIAVLGAMGLYEWALFHASLCFLIGAYREFEESHFSLFISAGSALVMTTLFWMAGLYTYSAGQEKGLKVLLLERLEPVKDQIHQVPYLKDVDLQNFIWFTPAFISVTFMMVLFVSVVIPWRPNSTQSQIQIRMFKLPDWMIWSFIGSLGASFITGGHSLIPILGMNVLIVTLAAYFFQGLAVMTYFLDRMGIYGFWRLLAYFLVFFQMQIFICGLGILDFWFDFRLPGILNVRDQSQKRS